MHDGFDITFREVIPESGIVELVVRELERVPISDGLHCSVIVSQIGPEPMHFDVQVELLSGALNLGLRGYAVDNDQYCAMRQAFAALRDALSADSQTSGTSRRYARQSRLRTVR
jgi:hypothetical protein